MKQYVSLVALSLLSLQAAALDLAKHPQVFDAGQGVSLARFRSIGAELLRKPFGPEDLLKAVSLALKRRRPAAWVPECRATIGR